MCRVASTGVAARFALCALAATAARPAFRAENLPASGAASLQ